MKNIQPAISLTNAYFSDITKRYHPFTKSVILSIYYKVVSSKGGGGGGGGASMR